MFASSTSADIYLISYISIHHWGNRWFAIVLTGNTWIVSIILALTGWFHRRRSSFVIECMFHEHEVMVTEPFILHWKVGTMTVFTLINRHIGTLWSTTTLWTHRSCKVWGGIFQDHNDDTVYTEPSHYDHCVQYQWQIDMVNIVLHCTFGSKSRICQIVSWHNTAHLLPYVSPLFAVSQGECVLDMQHEPHFCSHRKVSLLHSVELWEW